VHFKLIMFKEEAVSQEKAIVGQHYHTKKSNRKEFFVIVGKISEAEKGWPGAVIFKFRKVDGTGTAEIALLRMGDACYIPPGYSHSFKLLTAKAYMIGKSNKPYNSEDDVKDKLF
jgi:dTDP-4-dehydrorhamnose 3,5-epimerase-like enzyme